MESVLNIHVLAANRKVFDYLQSKDAALNSACFFLLEKTVSIIHEIGINGSIITDITEETFYEVADIAGRPVRFLTGSN